MYILKQLVLEQAPLLLQTYNDTKFSVISYLHYFTQNKNLNLSFMIKPHQIVLLLAAFCGICLDQLIRTEPIHHTC